jgi:hypothetical protein
MWVFTYPLTHKTTHKNFKVSFDALTPNVGGSLAETGKWGGVFQGLGR